MSRMKTVLVGMAAFLAATPVMAQDGSGSVLIEFSGALGTGLVVIGAALGISKLASAALESMARQPEVAGSIQTAMIIAAALIEGFTFYAIFVCSGQNPWGT
ncbi:ATP synthase subunit c [Symmachiella dynata]|uniref:ATP synthase subunit c n=3 Tax=Planctomycetaceae TaxID=126 RepID=A0A517ZS93_9PLAN|nr:ATP synthase subunit c [Symmachiella dynata]QDU45324.1 ATP synthase subunit c [Symmachiella dynata]TWU07012.1 ATP synthase subunit c [Symmachiella macrocystis]